MQSICSRLLLVMVLGSLPTVGTSTTTPPNNIPCDGNPPLLPSFTPLPQLIPDPNPSSILRQGPYAYIPNTGDNTVSIINLSANLPAVAFVTLNVGLGPQGIVIDPGGKYIYISNHVGDSVSVIEAPVHAVVATLSVGDGPASMVLHAASGRLYVANQLAKTISVIDTATRTVVDTLIPGGIPDRLLVHPGTGYLYVLSQQTGNLAVIDPQTHAITHVAVLDSMSTAAHDMVMDSSGAIIYITLHNTRAATTRAAIFNTVSRTVFFPDISLPGPPKGLAIHPAQSRLYVATDIYADSFCPITGHASVHVIDTASRQIAQTLPIPQGIEGINIDRRGWLYAANKKTANQLEILDGSHALTGQSITVGANPKVLGQVVGPELGGILSISNEDGLTFSGTLPTETTERIITVTNRGVLPLTIQQPRIVTDPPDTDIGLSITGDTCSTQTLAPTEQCQVTLRFSPKSDGVVSASFSITSTALTSPAPVPVIALGLKPPAPATTTPPPEVPIGGVGALDPWALLTLAGVWGVMQRRRVSRFSGARQRYS